VLTLALFAFVERAVVFVTAIQVYQTLDARVVRLIALLIFCAGWSTITTRPVDTRFRPVAEQPIVTVVVVVAKAAIGGLLTNQTFADARRQSVPTDSADANLGPIAEQAVIADLAAGLVAGAAHRVDGVTCCCIRADVVEIDNPIIVTVLTPR
jgi:hypothetical protein